MSETSVIKKVKDALKAKINDADDLEGEIAQPSKTLSMQLTSDAEMNAALALIIPYLPTNEDLAEIANDADGPTELSKMDRANHSFTIALPVNFPSRSLLHIIEQIEGHLKEDHPVINDAEDVVIQLGDPHSADALQSVLNYLGKLHDPEHFDIERMQRGMASFEDQKTVYPTIMMQASTFDKIVGAEFSHEKNKGQTKG